MRNALVSSAFVALAAAAPLEERQAMKGGPSDIAILNYALTLEYLEMNFYMQGLNNYTEKDFLAAGAEPRFYNNLKEIYKDESTHVSTLAGALGNMAVGPCKYAFPSTDAASFLAVDNVLEGVGVSAYLGAAKYITSPTYLTIAGAILTVEARHNAYIRDNQNPPESPFPSPFDIPLDFDEVYSLAAQFIVPGSCPSTNGDAQHPLPMLKAFPAIAVSPASEVKPGQTIDLTVAKSVMAKKAYFVTLTMPIEATLKGSGSSYEVVIPSGVPAGQAYLVLTNGQGTAPTDDNIVAGPAVVMIADNDYGLQGYNWNKPGYQWNHGGHWGKKSHAEKYD